MLQVLWYYNFNYCILFSSPKWEEFQQVVYVSEDEPEESTVTIVRAKDADSDEFGRVMYYITDDEIGKFTIDTNTVSFLLVTHMTSRIVNVERSSQYQFYLSEIISRLPNNSLQIIKIILTCTQVKFLIWQMSRFGIN